MCVIKCKCIVCVCVSVKSHLTSGASVSPDITYVRTYSTGNEVFVGFSTAFKNYGAKQERKSQYANLSGSTTSSLTPK